MEQYAIKGGNPLVGEVEIGGAKNAALPILAASVMTDETVYIENMPDVRDTPFIWRLGTRRSAARLLERAVEGVVRVTEASSRKSLPVVMLV